MLRNNIATIVLVAFVTLFVFGFGGHTATSKSVHDTNVGAQVTAAAVQLSAQDMSDVQGGKGKASVWGIIATVAIVVGVVTGVAFIGTAVLAAYAVSAAASALCFELGLAGLGAAAVGAEICDKPSSGCY